MSDVDTDIKALFGRLVAATPPAPPMPTGGRRRRNIPSRSLVVAMSAAAAVLLIAGLLTIPRIGRRVESIATSTPRASGVLAVRTGLASWRLPVPVHRTTAVSDGARLFLLGGLSASGVSINDVYAFDPATGRPGRVGTLTMQTHGAAALWVNAHPVVFGGAGTSPTNLVQSFDPVSRSSTVLGHLPGPRADVAAALVGGRELLLAGFDGATRLGDVLVSSDARSFHAFAHLPEAIRYPAVAVAGHSVYLFGGLITGLEYSGTFSANIQRVDADTGKTSIVGRLPTPRAHAMAAVLDGRVFVIGGSTPTGPSTDVLEFDPSTGRVSRIGTLPKPVSDAGIAVVGNTAYVLGGMGPGPLSTVMMVRLEP